MRFTELKQHLSAQQPHAAYLVTGEDAFLRKSAVDFFKKLVLQMPELNLSVLTEPSGGQAIVEAAEALPLLSPVRVVLVTDYKGDMNAVEQYLVNPCPTTVLVFECATLTANLSKVVKNMTVVDCDRLDINLLRRWIAAAAKDGGAQITAEAADLLIEYCDRNLSRIAGEVMKLCAYRFGGTVESADVRALVTADIEVKIFELSDALGKKQTERVASVLSSLLGDNTSVISLMGLLYSHFRRMLYCAVTPPYEGLAADLGVKEFAVKKAKEQAARFSPLRLKKICESFHRADADFKKGKITDRMALDLFILQTLNA